jgi:hypothetical protein
LPARARLSFLLMVRYHERARSAAVAAMKYIL